MFYNRETSFIVDFERYLDQYWINFNSENRFRISESKYIIYVPIILRERA